YILLHEYGHIVSTKFKVHPNWQLGFEKGETERDYPFLQQSWKVRKNGYVSAFDESIPFRNDLSQFSEVSFSNSRFREWAGRASGNAIFRAIERTNFPSVLAATRPPEDFAESFASYVHSTVLKRPYQIFVEHGGSRSQSASCWGAQRCRGKEKILRD